MKEYITFRGKILGYINYEDKSYISRRGTEHFFKIFNGFGVSLSLLEYLEQKNINKVIIEFNNFLLETTIDKFYVWGKEWKDSTFGKEEIQIILSIEHFNESKINKDLQMCL